MQITPALPRHPFTGLQALAVLPSGRPVWPVQGGDERAGEGGGDGGGTGQNGGQGGGSGTGDNGGGGGERTFTQAELDRIISDRISREREKYSDYDQLKAAAGELEQIKDADKTELQRAQDAAAAAERRAAEAEQRADRAAQDLLRSRVGAAKGLSPALAARLVGTTEEEIAADADDLLASMGTGGAGGNGSGGDGGQGGRAGGASLDQGARGTSRSDKPTTASGAELYAQRHGKRT